MTEFKPERGPDGKIIPYKHKLVEVKRKKAKEQGAYQSGRKRPSVQIAFYELDDECGRWGQLAREQGYRNMSELALVLIAQHFGEIPDQARAIIERVDGPLDGSPQKVQETAEERKARELLEWEYSRQQKPRTPGANETMLEMFGPLHRDEPLPEPEFSDEPEPEEPEADNSAGENEEEPEEATRPVRILGASKPGQRPPL